LFNFYFRYFYFRHFPLSIFFLSFFFHPFGWGSLWNNLRYPFSFVFFFLPNKIKFSYNKKQTNKWTKKILWNVFLSMYSLTCFQWIMLIYFIIK
jgi:hypothetical protein